MHGPHALRCCRLCLWPARYSAPWPATYSVCRKAENQHHHSQPIAPSQTIIDYRLSQTISTITCYHRLSQTITAYHEADYHRVSQTITDHEILPYTVMTALPGARAAVRVRVRRVSQSITDHHILLPSHSPAQMDVL